MLFETRNYLFERLDILKSPKIQGLVQMVLHT